MPDWPPPPPRAPLPWSRLLPSLPPAVRPFACLPAFHPSFFLSRRLRARGAPSPCPVSSRGGGGGGSRSLPGKLGAKLAGGALSRLPPASRRGRRGSPGARSLAPPGGRRAKPCPGAPLASGRGRGGGGGGTRGVGVFSPRRLRACRSLDGETEMKLSRAWPAPVRLLVLQLLAHQVLANHGCANGHLSPAGDCCDPCPPGYGVAVPCGATNTVCEPCPKNVMFSSTSSATEPCRPCSSCPGHAPMLDACTPTHDTVCAAVCPRGHFLPAANGTHSHGPCRPCQVCPEGYGTVVPCGPSMDTVCQKCPEGFYSEIKSSSDPCLPCHEECKENEVMIQACTPFSDTLCMEKELQILKRTEGEAQKNFPKQTSRFDSEGSVSANVSSPEFVPPLVEDNSKYIIPVYCSILAAVVVGLLAYVAFKCWTSCKQKHQLAKARAGETVSSPEGEKLPSDSGVFLDTHSLQEHHPLHKAHKMEPQLYTNLPPHKQEEIEQLLEAPPHGKDWRCLADHLGYEEGTIDTFGRGEAPAHTLLSDWSSKEGATLDALSTALVAIERVDVAENLNAPLEVSSVV